MNQNQRKNQPDLMFEDEGDKQKQKQIINPTPDFREFAFCQQISQFKAYISKKIDNQLLILSNQGNTPRTQELKTKRERLNYQMTDFEAAISHPKLGEMAKSFIQACKIVNRE